MCRARYRRCALDNPSTGGVMQRMDKKKKDWPTQLLWLGTAAAVVVVVWMLAGAGLFRPGGDYLSLDKLEHVGSFVGGVFTPIAVGWAARTFLVQREQMVETLQ